MVGEGVLHQALKHPEVELVLVIGRRPCGVAHPKLKEVIHNDFLDYSSIEKQLEGYNACYFCLGVSSVGMNEKDYARLTYDLTMEAAKTLAELNPDMTFCYVSGAGTNENGRLMWQRVKGKTEADLTKLPFKNVYLFRPGFIKPIKGLKRAYRGANLLGLLYSILEFFFRKHVCKLEDVGLAMISVTKNGPDAKIIDSQDMAALANGWEKQALLRK